MLSATHLDIAHKGCPDLVRDASFVLGPGSRSLLCGRNGSGKTTLLRTLAGVLPPSGGSFRSDGAVVMVPSRIPKVRGFKVEEFLGTGLPGGSSWRGVPSPHAISSMEESMSLLGVAALRGRDISTLSDGEFQRCCIAAGVARILEAATGGEPGGCLLLDEPTAFLDVDGKTEVLGAIGEAARRTGIPCLISSHDLGAALRHTDTILALPGDGSLLVGGPDPVSRTEALRAAFPKYLEAIGDSL